VATTGVSYTATLLSLIKGALHSCGQTVSTPQPMI
jgi:hypothetical protein